MLIRILKTNKLLVLGKNRDRFSETCEKKGFFNLLKKTYPNGMWMFVFQAGCMTVGVIRL